VCRRLRAAPELAALPVIMLTARGDDVDKIVGLELGADDYLAKPFNPRELLARIHAVLRRGPRVATRDRFSAGRLEIDFEAREVTVAGQRQALTAYEFELLAALARAAGRVLSREQLLDALKGATYETFDRSIDVHISKLRGKLEANPKQPRYIKTVRGAGYELPALTPAEQAAVRAGRVVVRARPMGFAAAPIRDPSSGAVVAFVEGAVPRPMGAPPLWRPVVIVGLALLVVAIATRPLAQRISRPLERLTAAARRLGGGDLSARAPADGAHARRGDEISELTRAFNEMAERVERLVRSEKDLLANVSHELRSPLARIRVA